MVAELVQSPAQVANFAPVKPLLELKRGAKKPDSRLAKAIKERFEHFHRKDTAVFREICNVGQLTSLMINGNHWPMQNPIDGSWTVVPLRSDDRRPLNILNNLKQNLLAKWENSNPDILVRPGRNLDTAVSAAKAADTVNNYYERQFYNHWFSQQEGLLGMTFGTYIDRYRYDDAKVSMTVIADVFEQKQATFGTGYAFCADCGYSGNPQEFQSALGGDGPMAQQMCPQCRSTAVDVQQAPTGLLQTVAGHQKHQIGDLVCELLPMPACRWDLSRRPEDSSWFIYRQRIPKGAVTRILGNVLLPANDSESDVGLDVLRALGHQGMALRGKSVAGNDRRPLDEKGDEVTFDEMWLSPDDYADINLIGDEETVEGAKIPKGKLLDVFPDGLCAVGLNGMSVVLALYPEQHRKHIVSGTWFMQAATGAGRGLADSVEIQRLFNAMNNQALQYMTSTYSPAIGYDNQIWTGSKMKYIGTPRTNIPFDLTKLPEGRKLHDSIYQFQPTAMPNQFFNFAQNFMNVMFQKTSMVTDFANGEPGITAMNTTATAAEIDQGNADAINQPIFMIKADARKRGAQITIDLFRRHFPMKRYFALGGKYGEQQGVELSGADCKADLVFEVARNSEMPKGPYTRQKNLMQFFQVVQGGEGYLALQQANPKLANQIETVFDVELETDDFDSVAELCRRRMDQMVAAMRANVTDPQALIAAIQPPISAVELQLKQKADWFASWLSTDEGIDAPLPLRVAAEFLAQGQFQGSVEQESIVAAGQGTVAAAQIAPAAMGQAALEQQGQQESTEPDPTAQMQFEQELTQQQHEATEAAKDREHELAVIAAEGKRDKDVAQHDATQKIKIEKAKPKPKPAAKPASKGAKK